MRQPAVHELAEELYAAVSPGQTYEQEHAAAIAADWETLWLCDALSMPLQIWWDLVHGNDEPWDLLLDPDFTPAAALPYLAQFVGVEIQPGWSEERIREEIELPSNWARGRRSAILLAIQGTLTGEQFVQIIERPVGAAYQLFIRTLTSQTPSPTRTLNVILANKPAGIVLDYAATNARSWLDLNNDFTSWAAVKTRYDSWDEELSDLS